MSRTLSTARFSAVLAMAAIIFGAGLVSGAAGDPLILGSTTNNSGTAGTKITSNNNGNGFAVSQNGVGASANGLRGDANTGTGGVFTSVSNNALFATVSSANRFGAVVRNTGASTDVGGALLALGGVNNAIVAETEETAAIVGVGLDCTGFLCGAPGVVGQGIGLAGGVEGEGFLGVFGIDSTGTGDGFGLFTGDDASIGGDLSVGGTCTGCTAAFDAANGGKTALAPGTAVTVLGAQTDADGNVLLTVGPASAGDTVIGLVAGATRTVQSGTEGAPATVYKPTDGSAAPGGTLRVVTSGILAYAAADTSGGSIAAGDSLVLSASSGKLAKGADGVDSRVGVALGALADGRVAIWVDPQ
jgi:hypothetical protein